MASFARLLTPVTTEQNRPVKQMKRCRCDVSACACNGHCLEEPSSHVWPYLCTGCSSSRLRKCRCSNATTGFCSACDRQGSYCGRDRYDGDAPYHQCAPCFLASFAQWCTRHDMDYIFVCDDALDVVENSQKFLAWQIDTRHQDNRSLTVNASVQTMARSIAKTVTEYVLDELAGSRHCRKDPTLFPELPAWVLLRHVHGQDWAAHKIRDFSVLGKNNLLQLSTKLSCDGAPQDTPTDLQSFGACLRMQYVGPFMDCVGGTNSFQACTHAVPYHPSHLPISKRATYWRWINPAKKLDLMVASKRQLFHALLDFTRSMQGGCCDSGTGMQLDDKDACLLHRLTGIMSMRSTWISRDMKDFYKLLEAPDMQLSSSLDALSDDYAVQLRAYFGEPCEAVWDTRLPDVARPLRLVDYHNLASVSGMRYLGVAQVDNSIISEVIPDTLFRSTAVFEHVGVVGPVNTTKSYYSMHMNQMRTQPTVTKLMQAMNNARLGPDSVPRLEDVKRAFPSSSHGFVDCLWKGVLESDGVTQWALRELRSKSLSLLPLRNDPSLNQGYKMKDPHTSIKPSDPDDLTAHANHLQADNLHTALNDLVKLNPVLKREQRRCEQSLRYQKLSHVALEGLLVGNRRGSALLVKDYTVVVLKHVAFRKQAVASCDAAGAAFRHDTGENPDMETRYEHLPISPLVVRAMSELGASSLTIAVINILEGTISRCKKLVQDVLGDSNVTTVVGLTKHEETLGLVAVLQDAEDSYWLKIAKHSVLDFDADSAQGNQAALTFKVLRTFSTTAFVELTEKWFHLPGKIGCASTTVSNHDPMEIRAFGRTVYDEKQLSSKPLVDAMCCMCGQLLLSKLRSGQHQQDCGKAGVPCQLRTGPCSWSAMPLFLLLWSKKTLAKNLPSVFEYIPSSNQLRLKHGFEYAPWLKFVSGSVEKALQKDPLTPIRKETKEFLDMEKSWNFCDTCHEYWHPTATSKIERVPMRNKLEGLYTRWHVDRAYVHLHPHLRRLYPTLTTLPAPADALIWHRKYYEWVGMVKELDPFNQNKNEDIAKARAELDKMEYEWSPPPHLTPWQTPVPLRYFNDAAASKQWCLKKTWNVDLVPLEQSELMQDAPECPALQKIQSGDARACISIVRPHGVFTSKHLGPNRACLDTMLHQSGELFLRPLTLRQDEARGMFSSLVCSKTFESDMLLFQESELIPIQESLAFLNVQNPWFGGYKSTVQKAKPCREACLAACKQGRLLSTTPATATSSDGRLLTECLGDEPIGLLVPLDDLSALEGTYRHGRAAAEKVYMSELRASLPPEWNQDSNISDMTDEKGRFLQRVPQVIREESSFTDVSFRDIHLDSKVWVQQHKWGTGSYRSTLDCLDKRAKFRRARFFSLDGEFLDDRDPQWLFFQREAEYKWRLFTDYFGKRSNFRPETGAMSATTDITPREQYSLDTYSRRLGHLIPESNQSLAITRRAWLEAARPGNLGAPCSMTTVVANVSTSGIVSHVMQGPMAKPDPEQTISFLFGRIGQHDKNSKSYDKNRHAGIQTLDYLRRRKDFESRAYRNGHDGKRGRIRVWMRRRESQKRGYNHDHYNEFAERCGRKTCINSSLKGCHNISRFCLRAGEHCRLPSWCNGNARHVHEHVSPATAEMLRPYPIGTTVTPPDFPLNLQGMSLKDTEEALEQGFWTADRLDKSPKAVYPVVCHGSLLERVRTVIGTISERRSEKNACPNMVRLNFPMMLSDLGLAYYVRRLQIHVAPHVCAVGYCRHSWSDRCKFLLPCSETVHTAYHNEVSNRWTPVRRHLPDDAYNKSTCLHLLVDTGMNVQINEHSPYSACGSLAYSLKYATKPEPGTKVNACAQTDDIIQSFLGAQFVSLSSAAALVLGDAITQSSLGEMPHIMPSWFPFDPKALTQGTWKRYTQRLPLPDMESPRYGYSGQVLASALTASLLFSTAQKVVRYFIRDSTRDDKGDGDVSEGDADVADDASDAGDACGMAPTSIAVGKAAQKRLKGVRRINRHNCDDVQDEIDHASLLDLHFCLVYLFCSECTTFLLWYFLGACFELMMSFCVCVRTSPNFKFLLWAVVGKRCPIERFDNFYYSSGGRIDLCTLMVLSNHVRKVICVSEMSYRLNGCSWIGRSFRCD